MTKPAIPSEGSTKLDQASLSVPMLTQVRQIDAETPTRPIDFRLYARMLRYAKPHMNIVGWLLVCCLLRAVQLPLLDTAVSRIIGGPITRGTFWELAGAVAGYVLLGAFTQYTLYYRMGRALTLGEAVVHDLRRDIFSQLQRLTMSFFHKTRLGRIISRMTSDADVVRQGLQDAIFVTIVGGGQIIVALLIMAWTDQFLFLVVLATTPLYYLTCQYFRSRLIHAHRATQESFSRVTSTLAESVSGVRVTQSFVRQDLNAEMWNHLVVDHARYNMMVVRAAGQFSPMLELLGAMLVASIFVIGGWRVLAADEGTKGPGSAATMVATAPVAATAPSTEAAPATAPVVAVAPVADAPTGVAGMWQGFCGLFHSAPKKGSHAAGPLSALLVFYFLISNQILGPLQALGNNYTLAINSMAGAERVFGLLDRQPDFADPPDAVELPRIRGDVEFRNLTFGYEPNKPVLRDITFRAAPGQAIALVGHTGSGKSSIINLISKFYLPTSGELLIDGVDIHKVSQPSLHRQMGIVLQANFLFTGTVMENIMVGRADASAEDVRAACAALDCLDMIEAMPEGFDTQVGERGAGLSLGERQLVCFARAMIADPRIIILDEATSAVDTLTEVKLQTALTKLLRGRTSFVVAHRLSTIRHADVVLVLDHGRIVERGTHDELLAAGGVYSSLYLQFIQAGEA